MSIVEQYRDHLIMRGRTPATVKAYVGAVYQLERFTGRPICEVRPADAGRWRVGPGMHGPTPMGTNDERRFHR